MRFEAFRTGIRRDPDGNVRKTGLEVVLGPLRVSTFQVPTKEFGVYNRRLCVEFWRFHALLTWRGKKL